MSAQINETALRKTIEAVVGYRPYLDQDVIRQTISDYLTSGVELLSETSQDIVWAYNKFCQEKE